MNRIASLVRYDWMLHKHNIKLTYGVIALIYVCIAILYFLSKSLVHFNDEGIQQLPQIIATFCMSFFNYAQWAIMFLMATIVTEKFCYPRTATAYLPLPGTPLEKFCVVWIDFFAAWVGIKVLFLIMFYLTMGVCAISSPDLDWAQNGFALLIPSGQGNMVTNMINGMQGTNVEIQMENMRASGIAFDYDRFMAATENLQQTQFLMNPFGEIAGVAFYLILCMLFKTNVQIKAIGCMVLSYITYMVAAIIVVFSFLGHVIFSIKDLPHNEADPIIVNEVFGSAIDVLEFSTCCLYGMPFLAAALLWVFYYQIKHKQAK